MPAAVEEQSAVYANTPAWHRLGKVIDTNGEKGLTVKQVIETADFGWKVHKVPSLALPYDLNLHTIEALMDKIKADPDATIKLADLIPVQDRHAVQRDRDSRVYGVVGNTWQPTQPIDGFDVVDELMQQAGGKAWIESAISLDGGKKVIIMVHLDHGLQIAGEHYASYLTFMNGFDGRTSLTAFCHDERIVCANTLAIGLGQGKKSGRIIRVRHTKNAKDRILAATEVLQVRNERLEQLAIQAEWMVGEEADEKMVDHFLSTLMPIKAEDGTPAHTMQTDRKSTVRRVIMEAPNLEPIRMTRWGLLQGVIEYADHKRPFRDECSQMKAQFGLNEQQTAIKDRAADILRLSEKKWDAFATA